MGDVFYAYMKGRGEGCDYTIGCNLRLKRLSATMMEDAIVEAVSEWTTYDDEQIERITILRVVEEADCGEHIAALRAERIAAKKAAELAMKRAQLERLKREVGES